MSLTFCLSLSLSVSLLLLCFIPFPGSLLADESIQAYTKLSTDGVVLAPSLLSRFLELCREQVQGQDPSSSASLPPLALEVLRMIRDGQESCSIENYHLVLRILETCRRPVE